MNIKNRFAAYRKTVVFFTVLFLAFAVLKFLIPYSGDDWAWGSYEGIERLKDFFDGYNGRYLGNILVILLTRSKVLNVLVVAASMVGLCLIPCIISGSLKYSTLILSTLLFFLMPKDIFTQSVAWTAGYANYVPPIMIVAVYFILIKNIFEDEALAYRAYLPAVTFLLGISSALFMEHVTLYSVAISFVIIAFVGIKFKKVYFTHIAYSIGSVVGCMVMFFNSAYRKIAESGDTYRSTALNDESADTVMEHINSIVNTFFLKNLPIFVLLSIMCLILTVVYIKGNKKCGRVYASYASVTVNILCLAFLLVKNGYQPWYVFLSSSNRQEITIYFFAAVAFMYCVSVLTTVLLCVKDKNAKFRMLLSLISVPLLIAPLTFVNPIGPRCFFPPLFMLMIFCTDLFNYTQEHINVSISLRRCINASLSVACATVFVFLLSIYSSIYTYDIKREEYLQKQIDSGATVVKMCRLPYGAFVWTGNPENSLWAKRYKAFHGIDSEIEFEYLDYWQFDDWIADFDKTGD